MSFQVYQAQGLRIYTGDTATISSYTGLAGEIAINTETKSVRILDGINAGGTPLTTADAEELTGLSLDQLADLALSSPNEGDTLVYKNGSWTNDRLVDATAAVDKMSKMIDVEMTNLQTGHVLAYNAASQKWVNQATATVDHNHDARYQMKGTYLTNTSNLSEVSDVQITMPADGQSLVYDAGYQKWVNTTVAGGSGDSNFSGAVLQVQHNPFPTNVVSPSQSWVDAQTVTFTPKSATSKILVMVNYGIAGKGSICLLRNGTPISSQTSGGRSYMFWQHVEQTDSDNWSERQTMSIVIEDQPNTTSAVTYKTQLMGLNQNGICVNPVPYREGNGVFSGMTIWEIDETSSVPVKVTDPTNGETLVYEDGKWVNSTAYSELDTDSSRGATTNADNSELPAFACRAFCTFDGTDFTTVNGESHCKILCSGNISKVVRHSTGWYRVHFKTSMPDNNYSPSVTGTGSGTTGGYAVLDSQDFGGAGSNNLHQGWFNIRAVAFGSTANLYTDHPRISIQVFR